MTANWLAGFPELQRALDGGAKRTIAAAEAIHIPRGTAVYRPGDDAGSYLLVLSGSIRVFQTTENGNEILLYRVLAGQPCVLTTSCLLGGTPYPAEGITETEVDAVTIGAAAFREGLASSPGFREFVFSSYGRRLVDLMALVQSVAFGRIESRLAAAIIALAGEQGQVKCTHQALAVELGTAREVVSRQLKVLERRGLIALGRGTIAILQLPALQNVVDERRGRAS